MRSRIPILLAAVGLIVAGALAWRGETGNLARKDAAPTRGPEEEESRAGKDPGESRTFSREESDPFSGVLRGDGQVIARDDLLTLFNARVGETEHLPVGKGIAGTVTLVHRHASGDLAIGLELTGFEDASAFFSLSPEGRLGGHLLSRRSATAYRLEATEQANASFLRKIHADELVCVRYERGRLLPGMPPEPEASEASDDGGGKSETVVPLLESLPGSSRVIYLNFAGETVAGTPWNSSYNGGVPIVAKPFSNPALIPEIWESVAEDYAVFDANVTTDRAAYENATPNRRVMVIFTPTKAWYGSAGGVAYLNSFGSGTNPYCWVFNVTLSGAAESGSHEIGHTVGLRHDGTSSRVYYTGHTHASGVSWAPIMGTGYGQTIVQFSRGEYPNANRTEDDFSIASGYLPFRPDDHGDSPSNASAITPGGAIAASGVIERAGDEDWFRFESGAPGPLSVTATPHPRFRNLDIGLELLDETLAVVAVSASEGPFDASLDLPSLPAGVHYLRLTGTGLGSPWTGYGRYGSVGTYTLTGTYTVEPPPDTPTGLTAGDGGSTEGVLLAWNSVAQAHGYRLYRGLSPDAGDAVFLASSAGTTHLDVSAVAGTTYHYFVTSTNLSRESPRSPGESGWRQFLVPESPAPAIATNDSPHSIRVSWPAAERAQSYRIWRHAVDRFAGATELATTQRLSWHDTSTAPGDPHYYFIEAVNRGGISVPAGTPVAGVKIPMPLGTPTGLAASDDTSSLLTLVTWDAAEGATGYRVYRHTVESADGATEIARVPPTTSHHDTSAQQGVTYWYFVRAILAGGDSLPSNLDAGSRQIAPPLVPVSLAATQGSHPGGVSISWAAVPDASKYLVYRGTDAGPGTAELLGETSLPGWLDEKADPGRTYRYFVRAANDAGESGYTGAALGFGPETDPLDDAFENNDDPSMATPLTLREIRAVAVDGDPDWYEVTLDPGDTRLDFLVPYDPGEGSILLSLHTADGTSLAAFSGGDGARVISHTGEAGLTYLVLVERDDGAAVPYRLIWRSLSLGESGLEPDMKIGLSSAPAIGEGVRNANGAGQTLGLGLRPRTSRHIFVTLTSRSAVAGTFLLSSKGRQSPFRLDCDRLAGSQWQRVTTALRGGGVASVLEPFASASFRITVRRPSRNAGRPTRVFRFLTARPENEPAIVDVVRLRLNTEGKARR